MESKGMKFARQMMAKMGWEEGKGLGVNQQGMTEAIKPLGKFNVSGLGHKAYNDFQWWDHAFNKAAQAFEVKLSNDEGPVVEKVNTVGKLSTKKSATTMSDNLAYGTFKKIGTLSNGVEKSTSFVQSVPEEDFSVKLSDEDLFRVCGGRTAHKGARHGLTASGKLARIAQQEAELLEKLKSSEKKTEEKREKKKNELKLAAGRTSDVSLEQTETEMHIDKEQSDPAEFSSSKKSKKEKRKRKKDQENSSDDLLTNDKSELQETNNQDAPVSLVEQQSSDVVVKKKKKKLKQDCSDESQTEIRTNSSEAPNEEINSAASEKITKKKKKKKHKTKNDSD